MRHWDRKRGTQTVSCLDISGTRLMSAVPEWVVAVWRQQLMLLTQVGGQGVVEMWDSQELDMQPSLLLSADHCLSEPFIKAFLKTFFALITLDLRILWFRFWPGICLIWNDISKYIINILLSNIYACCCHFWRILPVLYIQARAGDL